MAYSYYQQYSPSNWGTNRFQFGAPPAPSFHPQPSWGGVDFYRAHAPSSDISLFDHAWNRVRDHRHYGSGSHFGGIRGVGVHEARHWHNRIYGGMGDLGQMSPEEMGHAAAYEAYRTWIHNKYMYEPLSGDRERQREGIIGLAVAEASRLLQSSPRGMDPFMRQVAAEAAAATASELYYWSRDRDEGDIRGRSLRGSHRGSYDEYDDPYAYDSDLLFSSRRGRSHSRMRSRSASHRHPLLSYAGSDPGMGAGMPIPSVASSVSYSGHVGSYPNHYSGGMMPLGTSPPQYATSTPMVMGSSYYNNGYNTGYVRPRSASMNMGYGYYPQTPQTQYVSAGGVVHVPSPNPANSLVVYTKSSKHHKHRHHRSRSKYRRSRSRSYSR
ncbi:hypothetical protein PM082_001472 [Marasmius tenuissimus]|nr:hypothetical protein PM082_001472 [Marasmius tenuissimus]